VAALVAEYQAGEGMKVLAARYGIHRHSVREHLDRAGVDRRPRRLSEEDIDAATAMYEAGSSLSKIGAHFGCDPTTVRRGLRRRGVVMRRPWDHLG